MWVYCPWTFENHCIAKQCMPIGGKNLRVFQKWQGLSGVGRTNSLCTLWALRSDVLPGDLCSQSHSTKFVPQAMIYTQPWLEGWSCGCWPTQLRRGHFLCRANNLKRGWKAAVRTTWVEGQFEDLSCRGYSDLWSSSLEHCPSLIP